SIRYQLGGVDYRMGFQQGYDEAYRQYSGSYAYRFNDSNGVREVNQNYLGRPDGYYDRSGRFHRYYNRIHAPRRRPVWQRTGFLNLLATESTESGVPSGIRLDY